MKTKELVQVLIVSAIVLERRTLRPYLMIMNAVITVGYAIFLELIDLIYFYFNL